MNLIDRITRKEVTDVGKISSTSISLTTVWKVAKVAAFLIGCVVCGVLVFDLIAHEHVFAGVGCATIFVAGSLASFYKRVQAPMCRDQTQTSLVQETPKLEDAQKSEGIQDLIPRICANEQVNGFETGAFDFIKDNTSLFIATLMQIQQEDIRQRFQLIWKNTRYDTCYLCSYINEKSGSEGLPNCLSQKQEMPKADSWIISEKWTLQYLNQDPYNQIDVDQDADLVYVHPAMEYEDVKRVPLGITRRQLQPRIQCLQQNWPQIKICDYFASDSGIIWRPIVRYLPTCEEVQHVWSSKLGICTQE